MWEAAAVEESKKKKRQTGERDQLACRRWKETEVAGRKRRREGWRAAESRRPWRKYMKKAAVARSYRCWVTQFGERKSDSPFRTPGSTAHFFSNMWPSLHSTGEEGRLCSCGARQAGDWFCWTSPLLETFFFLFPRPISWCQVTLPTIQRCADTTFLPVYACNDAFVGCKSADLLDIFWILRSRAFQGLFVERKLLTTVVARKTNNGLIS